MKVTLAYEYDGHKPDETVELDDTEARTLLREGRARQPQAKAAVNRRDAGTTTEKG